MKRFFKILKWGFGFFFGTILFIWIALQFESVQNFIVDNITSSLSKTLRTTVKIDQVKFKFFKSIEINGLFAADQDQDTLLAIKNISASIGLFSLLQQTIYLDNIEINELTVKLSRSANTEHLNYQFILDAFAKDTIITSDDSHSTSKAWDIGLGSATIKNTNFSMRDSMMRFYLETQLSEMKVEVNTLDLIQQTLDIQYLSLKSPEVNLEKGSTIPEETATLSVQELLFPYTGWNINAKDLIIQDADIRYWLTDVVVKENNFDTEHLDFKQLQLKLKDFTWDSTSLALVLNDLNFTERSGLTLNEAGLKLAMGKDKIEVENLHLKTPKSNIRNNTSLNFSSWNDLPNFLNQVNLKTVFSNSNLALKDLEYFIPYIPEAYRINKPVFLNGLIRTANNQVNLDALQLTLGDILNFKASGNIKNPTNTDLLSLDINLKELSIDYKKLRLELPVLNLPIAADSLGTLTLAGVFSGGIKSMDFQDIALNTSTNTFFKTSGNIKNITQPEYLKFSLNIDSFQTRAEDFAYFSKTSLPLGLYKMQQISYEGLLSGNLTDFNSQGELRTAIGELETDIKIDFDKDYANASYDGSIKLDAFDLGLFLGDTTTFGTTSLEAIVKGSGLSPDSLNTVIDATVTRFEFNKYDYKNIKVDGNIDQLKFVGLAGMEDKHLDFNFEGLVNLNEEIPVFEFSARIDTLDLSALNFSDQIIRTSANISSNFKGNTVDNFLGSAVISDLNISNKKEHFHSDSLVIKAKDLKANNKELFINSDLLKATVTGDFNLLQLPFILQNYVNDYFPIDQFSSSINQSDSLSISPTQLSEFPDQDMTFDLTFSDLSDLLKIFTPTVKRLESLKVKGNFDTQKKDFNIDLYTPNVEILNWTIDSLRWISNGDFKKLNSALSLTQLTDGAIVLRQNEINTLLTNKTAKTTVSILNKEEQPAFNWGALLAPHDKGYQLQFTDSLNVNDERWEINKEYEILFSENFLAIQNFILQKDQQSISIKTNESPANKNYTPIAIDFINFNASEFSGLVNLEGFKFEGLLNGGIVLNDLTENLHYLADVNLTEFTVNDTLIGRFDITAKQDPRSSVLNVSVGLTGNSNNMLAQGTYDIESTQLDIQTDITQIPLILIDPFTTGAINNSSGFIGGYLNISGVADQPIVEGELAFKDAATNISYLKTRYSIPANKIVFNPKNIDFGAMKLLDKNNNEALLSGKIEHDYFQNIRYNLNFSTDKFRFLNTAIGDNELFYGTLYLGAKVHIGGTLDLPKINITAQTLPKSKISVSALLEEGITTQAEYVIFGKPGEISLDSILLDQKTTSYSTPEIDLTLNLKLTQDAELIVVIDPSTGDQLSCRGNADLGIQMSPRGDISITGIYTVVNGTYQFNYQGLVKRSFDLKAGSRLNFVGDPLDTKFDLTATYKARTSIYSLIANESNLSQSATRSAKERSNVDVQLKMAGDLNRPIISFDLQVPESNVSVSSVIIQKLSQLREDETELNKQVFGLLLLNSFVAEQSATASLSTTGENIALSSVSGLISNQLNRLSDRYLKGVGLVFDLESYKSQFDGESDATTRTNLNVGLTQSIFNDRLTIKVGGVVQVDDGASSTGENSLSNIAGDFVLEYKIDKLGNYVLRVFQRSDYDAFNDSNSNKTGVGINFKKSFGE